MTFQDSPVYSNTFQACANPACAGPDILGVSPCSMRFLPWRVFALDKEVRARNMVVLSTKNLSLGGHLYKLVRG